jgi:hypothetical protein
MAGEMNGYLADQYGINGVVGVRAIVYFAGRFYSPVYGHCEWNRGVQAASCAIGCASVPSDRHQGCGFHAHWEVDESKRFVEQIRGTADCLVLVECFGRVVVHEKGFRSEQARIVGVLDWDPRFTFFTYPLGDNAHQPSVPVTASRYFGVPLLDEYTASDLIHAQRQRCLAA